MLWAEQWAWVGMGFLLSSAPRRSRYAALSQVWREAPLQVTAVEPCHSMSWLGQRVGDAHLEAHREHEAQQAQRARERERQAQQAQREAGALPEVSWQATWGGRQLSAERLQRAAARGGDGLERTAAAALGAAADPAGLGEGSGDGTEGTSAAGAPAAEAAEEGAAPVPPPRMRWLSRLPARSRLQPGGRQYDLVVAAYVLGELRNDEERRCEALGLFWQLPPAASELPTAWCSRRQG